MHCYKNTLLNKTQIFRKSLDLSTLSLNLSSIYYRHKEGGSMLLPDMIQFLLIVAALAFMSASTLFIFGGKQDQAKKETLKSSQKELR